MLKLSGENVVLKGLQSYFANQKLVMYSEDILLANGVHFKKESIIAKHHFYFLTLEMKSTLYNQTMQSIQEQVTAHNLEGLSWLLKVISKVDRAKWKEQIIQLGRIKSLIRRLI